jgi:anti-sigma regulatory factor (Ser/Thr protein kinase)
MVVSELTIQSDLSEIRRVSVNLARLGADHGVPDDALADLAIAIDEVLSNIINYAYTDSNTHEILVRLTFLPKEVNMEFIDDGAPFNPRSAPLPELDKRLQGRRVGGLGIHFVKALMDDVEYVRKGSRNHLMLRKKCVTTVKREEE